MASTFFNAPHISTPMTSVVMLMRMIGEANSFCTFRHSALSLLAATRPVGRSSITSLAKLGPDRNTVGCFRPSADGMCVFHTGIQGAEVVGREHLRSRDLGTSAINGRRDGGEGGSARGEGNQSEGGQLHDRR